MTGRRCGCRLVLQRYRGSRGLFVRCVSTNLRAIHTAGRDRPADSLPITKVTGEPFCVAISNEALAEDRKVETGTRGRAIFEFS
jgi:hypothetical protein